MKILNTFFALSVSVFASGFVNAQAINGNPSTGEVNSPECGSYHYMEHQDHQHPGYLEGSNQFLENLNELLSNQELQAKGATDLYTIPVVFHVVHNSPEENIPDSVFINQIELLNAAFRRTNADTIDTRNEFIPYVNDAGINFKLAEVDPNGAPTNGITRTSTNIDHFGGVLPYGPGQNQEIVDWVSDSLFPNWFRITDDTKGGKTAWDTDKYLNVWIGDLRIFEPQFNNFEEIYFFGLATPPENHVNFPDSIVEDLQLSSDGVLLHYVNVGANNPNDYPAAYAAYNGLANVGKTLVHEVGHYLGLRHIWGDGNCTADDFVNDTPLAASSSNYDCNFFNNTCTDNIDGVDLPNMVENYMDYSSGPCQNSFTKGQIAVMRAVLDDQRSDLPEVSSWANLDNETNPTEIIVYPNPNNGNFTIDLEGKTNIQGIKIVSVDGKLVKEMKGSFSGKIDVSLNEKQGVYFIHILNDSNTVEIVKLMVNTVN